MGHLTDIEISLLAGGGGSPALRSALRGHADNCPECSLRLAACVRATRPEALEASAASDPAIELRPETVESLHAGFQRAVAANQWKPPHPALLELFPVDDDIEIYSEEDESAAIPAAAHAVPENGTSGFQSFQTQRGEATIRFRVRGAGELVSVQLFADSSWIGSGARLLFREPELAFAFDDSGAADLPGIHANHLRPGNIRIHRDVESRSQPQ